MPRATRAQGRPGTQVIPINWDRSHAPVATKTMTLPVSLRHPGSTSTYDDSVGYSVTTPLAPYVTGINARIQAHRETAQDASQDQATESIRVTGYLVTLPLDCAPTELAVGDLIDISTNCSDPDLAGRALRVVDLVRGSLRFERDVFAVINDTAETRGA